jgi:hypothetical protein
MPETITVHDDLEIIEVHSFGQVTKEDLLQSLKAVDQIYQERGYNKVLIDAQEEEGIPNAVDLFMFGGNMEQSYIGKTGRFAVVTSEATRKDLEFLVKTIREKGVKINTFMSVDEALDWLRG